MKAMEARAYIFKAKKRIDEIEEELKTINRYLKDYLLECDILVDELDKIGIEEYSKRKDELTLKYNDLSENNRKEKALKLEEKNIEIMMIRAASVILVDELSKQPLKAINKPIHYKVFQEAFNDAKKKAWDDFRWYEETSWNGEERFYSPFSSFALQGSYSPQIRINKNVGGYTVYLDKFIDKNTSKLDIEAAKSYVENLPIIDIEEIKELVCEAIKTREEFTIKSEMLEQERKIAMEKFNAISLGA